MNTAESRPNILKLLIFCVLALCLFMSSQYLLAQSVFTQRRSNAVAVDINWRELRKGRNMTISRPSRNQSSHTTELIKSKSIPISNNVVCLHGHAAGIGMGWSNRIISLSCALDFARERNLRLAIENAELFTTDEYPDLETNLNNFMGYEGRSKNLILNYRPTKHVCQFDISWMDAFYRMRRPDGLWNGCFIHQLSPTLLDKGRRALAAQRPAHLPSFHLRALDGECRMRFDERNFICTRPIAPSDDVASPCAPTLRGLARRYGAGDFAVYSDGQDGAAEADFAAVDRHDFFTQYAMMALSPLHVGNLLSTVDLLVSIWREHILGPGTTAPFECYG